MTPSNTSPERTLNRSVRSQRDKDLWLIPNLTRKGTIPARVDLKTPVIRYTKGSSSPLSINVPIIAVMMQAVSDDRMAIALARCGELAFIFGSQSIASQAEHV